MAAFGASAAQLSPVGIRPETPQATPCPAAPITAFVPARPARLPHIGLRSTAAAPLASAVKSLMTSSVSSRRR